MAMAERSTGDRLSRIEALVENLAGDIKDMAAELHAATESAFPRTEANARSAEYDRRMLDLTHALGERLEVKQYQVAHEALIQRVARLETNPQRQLGWVAVAISGLGCFVTAGLGTLTILVSIAAIIITYTRK